MIPVDCSHPGSLSSPTSAKHCLGPLFHTQQLVAEDTPIGSVTDSKDTGIDVGIEAIVGPLYAGPVGVGQSDTDGGCRVDIVGDAAGVAGNNDLAVAGVAAAAVQLPRRSC